MLVLVISKPKTGGIFASFANFALDPFQQAETTGALGKILQSLPESVTAVSQNDSGGWESMLLTNTEKRRKGNTNVLVSASCDPSIVIQPIGLLETH